jgi:transposase-like protein
MARYANARTAEEYRRASKDKVAPNILTFVRNYGTEEQCEEALIKLRWPEGFKCERCGGTECRKLGTRREYYCTHCLKQFSATSGTMLAHTKVPLTAWFLACFLLVTDANGVSAQRVARECGVSDKTAGSMLRRLRTAMGFAMRLCKVGGDYVEVDGAHIACGNPGDEVTRPGSGRTDAPVLVAVSGSSCVIRATSDSTQGTMEEFASAHVSRNHEVRCDDHGANLALVGGWD